MFLLLPMSVQIELLYTSCSFAYKLYGWYKWFRPTKKPPTTKIIFMEPAEDEYIVLTTS